MTRKLLEQLALDFRPAQPPTLAAQDFPRLARQRAAVWGALCRDPGRWWTLAEFAELMGFPEASISARLRDFRKPAFGGHSIERRRRHGEGSGTWEYRLGVTEGSA